MALVVAQGMPTSSTMALSHGPMGVADARRRLRSELCANEVPEPVVDDAVLILSELLSNSYRHARPLCDGPDEGTGRTAVSNEGDVPSQTPDPCGIRAAWRIGDDGLLSVEVTDGGGPTRPLPASPSLTARGGRGLGIVSNLSLSWGVRDAPGEVTVWALLPVRSRHARRDDLAPRRDIPIDFADPFDDLP
ncbi:ATP-binding protein [Streptomyces sp. SPB162]|uniref:ATP-binding protein n=1 Tax=Streptomyces sp. SPB162 TaxID=2940560 RepID=UPI002407573B|nr:ATP-binding protein [Streptomyces sp. SPB162]MDF9814291.1 anti-sigma regulatory factor (Ser/Thr protein kinase) [Streptomyces sp. SPB162]